MRNPRTLKRLLAVTILGTATLMCTQLAANAAQAPVTSPDTWAEQFTTYSPGTWAEGTTVGRWSTIFNGYGTVSITGTNPHLRLSPKAATSPDLTHAALVTTSTPATSACVSVSAAMKTVKQLRKNSPANPWEVPWLLTNYHDPEHFYYLILKPNGYELGKRDPAYPGGQRFLATGDSITTPIGTTRTPTITSKVSATETVLTVTVAGVQIATFTDVERPYPNRHTGVYTEDAAVTFDNVRHTRC